MIVCPIGLSDLLLSIDSSSEQKVLDDGHDSDLRKVGEELIIFFLIGAAQDQIASKDKDARGKDRQYL